MEDIQKKLLHVLKSNEADAAITVGTVAITVAKPLTGILLTVTHEVVSIADEIRINAVIRGLSTELDQEKQINQLYGYVEKSEENAFFVVNTLRKALLADSLIACTIMGRILASHVAKGTVYDQDDIIVFHALENATDYDIRQFYKVMLEYLTKNDKGNDVFHIPNNVIMDPVFSSSLDWCVFNRIFNGTSGIRLTVDGQDYDDCHSPTSAAYKFLKYVDSIKQVLRYNSNNL